MLMIDSFEATQKFYVLENCLKISKHEGFNLYDVLSLSFITFSLEIFRFFTD